ncbi:Uncharacterised protein [Delftia tsuruhatensis]|nr:Uncharacterised protein [Delftia tsuruhatensis]CAC9685890.1 Uncharacterised protein [Delftia tsuruhatensis]
MPFALYAHRGYAASVAPADWTFIAYDESLADMHQQQWLVALAAGRPVGCELSDISGHLAAVLADRREVHGAGRPRQPAPAVGDGAMQLAGMAVGSQGLDVELAIGPHNPRCKTSPAPCAGTAQQINASPSGTEKEGGDA